MKKAFVLVVAAVVAGGVLSAGRSAQAIPAFKNEFDAKYVKKDATDGKEKVFADTVAKVKCNVCHLGTDKKKRNVYGEHLAKLLDKKADAKNKEKIQQALDMVAEMKVDPADANSPTFGQRIAEGKLPVEP